MWLPAPSPDGVKRFQRLVTEEFGLELSSEDALELATRVLQIHPMQTWEKRSQWIPLSKVFKASSSRDRFPSRENCRIHATFPFVQSCEYDAVGPTILA